MAKTPKQTRPRTRNPVKTIRDDPQHTCPALEARRRERQAAGQKSLWDLDEIITTAEIENIFGKETIRERQKKSRKVTPRMRLAKWLQSQRF